MKIIIGLGNPDDKYQNTFHNMGFKAAECVADLLNAKFKNTECKAKTAVVYNDGEKIVIAKPQTYMNLSGESVHELMSKYGAVESDIIVIYDDVDIPLGTLRIRPFGSAGTHNGMKNIVQCIGTSCFKRVRIGIGADRNEIPLMDYVLSRVSGEAEKLTSKAIARSAAAVCSYIKTGDFEKTMRDYND